MFLTDTSRRSNRNLLNKHAYNLALMNSRQDFVSSTLQETSPADQIPLNNSSLPQKLQIRKGSRPPIYPPPLIPPTVNRIVLITQTIQTLIHPPLALSTQVIRMQTLIREFLRLEMLAKAGISVLLLEVNSLIGVLTV